MTSATSTVRAALNVDRNQRPGHRGLRSPAPDPRRDPAAHRARSGSNLDRPDFALNPTNCEPLSVDATVERRRRRKRRPERPLPGRQLRRPRPSNPKLFFRLTGSTKRGQDPSLLTTIKTGTNEANFETAQVDPAPLGADRQAHIVGVCTRVQFAANRAPRPPASALPGPRPRCSTSPWKARSTSAPPPTTCPTSSPTYGARSTSSWWAEPTR